jgi:hypothetical protein
MDPVGVYIGLTAKGKLRREDSPFKLTERQVEVLNLAYSNEMWEEMGLAF